MLSHYSLFQLFFVCGVGAGAVRGGETIPFLRCVPRNTNIVYLHNKGRRANIPRNAAITDLFR